MPTVNLRETSYKATKRDTVDNSINIFKIIDRIEQYLIYTKSDLIIAINNGEIPKNNIINEIEKYIRSQNITLNDAESYEEILTQVNNYIWGYGQLQPYLEDLEISDIAIKNIKNDTWIKKNGKRERVPVEFLNYEKLKEFCYLICIKNGGNLTKINAKQRLSDTISLKDFNLRIVICVDPINSKSPSIVIRKIPKEKYSLEKLMDLKMLDQQQFEYLIRIVPAGCNILICGKGASGKTTLENALIELLPEDLSKLMIQESDELGSSKGNWIWQHTIEKQGESDVGYTLQELVTLGMLEDVDFIGIGEVKGPEAMDLIDAGYTGHTIHLTTHASSSVEALKKTIINMKKSGTDIKEEDLLDILSAVVDVVIFMKDFKIREITEVKAFNKSNNQVEYNPIFKYNKNNSWKNIGTSCNKIKQKITNMN